MISGISSSYQVSPPASVQRQRQGTTSVKARASQQGELKIKTAEGDTVTISFGAQQKLKAKESGASASSSFRAHVEVNGELSDQEMADIGKLMTQLGAAVKDGTSPDFADLTSINAYRYSYQESTQAQSLSYLA